jgi:hypothetical protein
MPSVQSVRLRRPMTKVAGTVTPQRKPAGFIPNRRQARDIQLESSADLPIGSLASDRAQRPIWLPSLSVGFRFLILLRFSAAMYANIQDCDEGAFAMPQIQRFPPDPERGQSTIFGNLCISCSMVAASRHGRLRRIMLSEVGRTFSCICHLLRPSRFLWERVKCVDCLPTLLWHAEFDGSVARFSLCVQRSQSSAHSAKRNSIEVWARM